MMTIGKGILAKYIASFASLFLVLTVLTSCATAPADSQEIKVVNENGGLEISWWAKNSDLNSPEDYKATIQFGSFEYELVNYHIYASKKEKNGLKKLYYRLGSGEIIYGTRQSTEEFKKIKISTFVNSEDDENPTPYLKTEFDIPEKAPSFDAGYSLFDQPWTDKIHVDFYVGNAWHFPDSYTCTLNGDISATTTVQLSDLPQAIFEENRPLPCRLTYDGSEGMKVSVSISASNEYGESPIFLSEQYTLTTFVSNIVPEGPLCPEPLSTSELQAKPGECGTFNVEVFQADLDTGACTFLANWPQSNGDTAVGIFHFCDVYGEGTFAEGKTYTISAKVLGTTSYVARIGGERTVVEFDLVK